MTDRDRKRGMTQLEKLINESDCPISFSVEKACPVQPYQPKPGDPWWPKPLDAGSTMPLTFEWPIPDNWLARASQWLAGLLYKGGIHWQSRWGRWRMDSLEAEGEVIQDNEAGLEWRVTPGAVTQGRMRKSRG